MLRFGSQRRESVGGTGVSEGAWSSWEGLETSVSEAGPPLTPRQTLRSALSAGRAWLFRSPPPPMTGRGFSSVEHFHGQPSVRSRRPAQLGGPDPWVMVLLPARSHGEGCALSDAQEGTRCSEARMWGPRAEKGAKGAGIGVAGAQGRGWGSQHSPWARTVPAFRPCFANANAAPVLRGGGGERGDPALCSSRSRSCSGRVSLGKGSQWEPVCLLLSLCPREAAVLVPTSRGPPLPSVIVGSGCQYLPRPKDIFPFSFI